MLVATVIAFVALAAFFVKCVQRQGVHGATHNRDPSLIYREIKHDEGDSLTSEEIERFNIGHILAKGTSRKHLFTGKVRQPADPVKKYAYQATPINEDSQEQYNTGYRSQKSIFSRREADVTQNSIDTLGGLLLSQSSQSSMEERSVAGSASTSQQSTIPNFKAK